MRALARLLADRSGQLLVPTNIAADLEISRETIRKYLAMLEEVFLIKRIPAWTGRISSRAVSPRKVAFVDSGVATSLLGLDTKALNEVGGPLGPLLEGFVMMELARQLTWGEQDVLENARGQVVAFEIKASSTVRGDDFRGLRHLEERLGDKFLLGAVLHTAQDTLSSGPKIRAIPIAAIWETPAPQLVSRHAPFKVRIIEVGVSFAIYFDRLSFLRYRGSHEAPVGSGKELNRAAHLKIDT
jgi:predicted AAA+ superfamily ATPase